MKDAVIGAIGIDDLIEPFRMVEDEMMGEFMDHDRIDHRKRVMIELAL
jgi:hypothetical protein